MVELSTTVTSPRRATTDYLRRARRVRARFAHDPVRMHRELNALSAVKVAAVSVGPGVRRVVSRLPEVFPFQSHRVVAEAFAAEVERSLEAGVLRYSRRATLLRQARQRGIRRFDANLIIATVQHRLTPRPVVAEAVIVQARDGQKHWWHVALTVAVAQSLIGFTVWWVLLR